MPLENAALLLVDVQKDFCPGGALPVPDGDRVIPALNAVIAKFYKHRRPIYASRDWHPPDTTHFREFGGPWPPHCVAETPGAEIRSDLRLPKETTVISKGQNRNDAGYSALEGLTPDGRTLVDDLRRRDISELYVGGLATDYCVRATVLDLRRDGFAVRVVEDGIAGIDPEDTRRALDEMAEAGASFTTSSS
jgi:nicotinamidase/pyrazinamidase